MADGYFELLVSDGLNDEEYGSSPDARQVFFFFVQTVETTTCRFK